MTRGGRTMSRNAAWALLVAQVAALWTMGWAGAGTPLPALVLWAVAFVAYAGSASRAETAESRS